MVQCNIPYTPKFFDAQPIWLALGQEASRLNVNHQGIQGRLSEVAIAIDIRGRILRITVQDAKSRMNDLLNAIPEPRLRNGIATRVIDKTVFGLLGSIDSFFFESQGLYEVLRKFHVSLLRQTKLETGTQPTNSFEELVRRTEPKGTTSWRDYLERNRHFFAHESTPYPAVEFTDGNPPRKEVVIESQPHVYLNRKGFDNVLKGLSKLSVLCGQDLIQKIKKR